MKLFFFKIFNIYKIPLHSTLEFVTPNMNLKLPCEISQIIFPTIDSAIAPKKFCQKLQFLPGQEELISNLQKCILEAKKGKEVDGIILRKKYSSFHRQVQKAHLPIWASATLAHLVLLLGIVSIATWTQAVNTKIDFENSNSQIILSQAKARHVLSCNNSAQELSAKAEPGSNLLYAPLPNYSEYVCEALPFLSAYINFQASGFVAGTSTVLELQNVTNQTQQKGDFKNIQSFAPLGP